MVSESTLYRLLTFQVPNLMSHFRSLGRTGISVQVRGFCKNFVTWYVFTVRSCWHLAQTPAGGPPLVGCPLIQYNRSYPLYVRPFLLPPPKDAPCRCDRHQLITDNVCVLSVKDLRYYYLSLLSVLFLYLQLQPGKYHLSEG